MFAQPPQAQRLLPRCGDDGIDRHAGLQRGADARFQQALRLRFGLGARQLHQRVVRMASGKRARERREVLGDQVQAEGRHQFKTGQRRAAARLQQAQQRERLARRVERHEGRQCPLRGRIQFEHRRRDNAQRAFGADEQLAQRVARVVLAQAAQTFPDIALRRDHFQAQAQVARVSVPKYRSAAGIGRQVAADRAGAFGGKRQGIQHAGSIGRCLHVGQDAAGFHRHGAVGRIDGADAVQAPQRQHDGGARGVGHTAHDQARAAALWHDRHARLKTGAHDRGNLDRVERQHDGACASMVAAAPVGQKTGHLGLERDDVGVTDDRAQAGQEGRAGSINHAGL